jgi:tight adherence protein C
MNPTLIIGSTAVAAAFLALWWAVTGSRPVQSTVTLGGVRRRPGPDMRAAILQRGVNERSVEPLVERLAGLARRYTPTGRISGLEQRLLLAGTPRGWTVERILAVKALAVTVGASLTVLRLLLAPSLLGLVLTAGLGALGFFAPDYLLRRKAEQRQLTIRRALADTVDQISVAAQAGLGLDAAMARVAVTTSGPLASEFARVTQDVRAGMRRSDALLRMSERIGLPEVRQLVTALTQAEKLGVPVAQTMRVQAAELRTKRRQQAEEQAMKLPVKLIFPMFVCILPCLFIVVLGPAAMSLFESLG